MEIVDRRRLLILEGNLYRAFFLIGVPVMLNFFIFTVYNLTDTYFVSLIGEDEATASMFLSWPVIFLVLSLAGGFGTAATFFVAKAIGIHDYDEARVYAGNFMSLAMLASLVFTAVLYFGAPVLMTFSGARGLTLQYAVTLLQIIGLSLPAAFLVYAYTAIKSAEGQTVMPMLLSLSSALINVVLDPIFIFVFDWGIAGAAWATFIARWFNAFVVFYLFFIRKEDLGIRFSHLRMFFDVIQKILKKGILSSMGQSLVALGFMILFALISGFGDGVVSAVGIVNRSYATFYIPISGLAGALSAIVGQNYGAGQTGRMLEALRVSFVISGALSILSTVILIYFARDIVAFFVHSGNEEIFSFGHHYMIWLSSGIIFLSYFDMLISLMNGSGRMVVSFIFLSARFFLLRLPLLLLFLFVFHWGQEGISYATFLSNMFAFVFLYLYHLYTVRRVYPEVMGISRDEKS